MADVGHKKRHLINTVKGKVSYLTLTGKDVQEKSAVQRAYEGSSTAPKQEWDPVIVKALQTKDNNWWELRIRLTARERAQRDVDPPASADLTITVVLDPNTTTVTPVTNTVDYVQDTPP